jgi:hypothetical protein
MLPLSRTGLSSSVPTLFRAAVVVLAWLALWFSALVATLERPVPAEADSQVSIPATRRV